MDGHTARWMRLKRLTPGEVEKFHDMERRGDGKSGNPWGFVRAADGHVTARAASLLSVLDDRLGAYWNRNKTEADRAAEVRTFERHAARLTYRILAADNPGYDSDLAALHAADRAVLKDDYEINREGGAPIASAALDAVYNS